MVGQRQIVELGAKLWQGPKNRERDGFFEEGRETPPHQLRVSGNTVSSPLGSGTEPRAPNDSSAFKYSERFLLTVSMVLIIIFCFWKIHYDNKSRKSVDEDHRGWIFDSLKI